MPSAMCCAPDALGVCCLMICHLGALPFITSALGAGTEPGRERHDTLRSRTRQSEGRQASPSAAIIDSQSVKTAEKGGQGATMRARR